MINCSDYFVIDDIDQYIKRGWINRNRILLNGTDHLITMPVVNDKSRLNINERYFVDEPYKKAEKKILDTICHAYHRAPYYNEIYSFIKDILYFESRNVAEFTTNSLKQICKYLDIQTQMGMESEVNPPAELNAQDRIIYVCKQMKAERYINAIGGTKLYSATAFNKNGLELKFIKTRDTLRYRQFDDNYIPSLSIIDVMMFNSKQEIKKLLSEYDLIDGEN